jgi:hypothetical protein
VAVTTVVAEMSTAVGLTARFAVNKEDIAIFYVTAAKVIRTPAHPNFKVTNP